MLVETRLPYYYYAPDSCTSESATHCSRLPNASGGSAATSVALAVRRASAQSICAESGRMEVAERPL